MKEDEKELLIRNRTLIESMLTLSNELRLGDELGVDGNFLRNEIVFPLERMEAGINARLQRVKPLSWLNIPRDD